MVYKTVKRGIKIFKIIIGLLLGILCVVFFIQNAETVTFVFLMWEISISRALMFVTVLIIGILLGSIFSRFRNIRRHK